jgi:glutathione synthase/RimK-type ligase-like ATP-grasp enzyme
MSETTLLIAGSTVITTWGRDQVRRLSEQARRRGVRLIGADSPQNLANASAGELAQVDEILPLDVNDPQACLDWAKSAAPAGLAAVLTIRELAVYSTALMARELGLAGNDPEAVLRIRNKDLCRTRLREAGFSQPATALGLTADDARLFMKEHGPGPWIIKPRDGLASLGVSLIRGEDDIEPALARLAMTPPGAFGSLSSDAPFLIETFVEGAEYSAEGVMVGGTAQVLALTQKQDVDFIETGHRVPASLSPAQEEAATRAVTGALREAGIARGIFHVEFWLNDGGVVIGELHDRPGGDYIHLLVEYARPGLELYGMLVDDLLSRDPGQAPAMTRAAAAQFLICPPGRLGAVSGWDELTSNPAVLTADLSIAPGDTVAPVADSWGRHGVFVVGGHSPEEVDSLTSRLRDSVDFTVTRPGE